MPIWSTSSFDTSNYPTAQSLSDAVQEVNASHLVVQRRAYNNEYSGIEDLMMWAGIHLILIGMGGMGYDGPAFGYDPEWHYDHLVKILTSEPTAGFLRKRIAQLDEEIEAMQRRRERTVEQLRAFEKH